MPVDLVLFDNMRMPGVNFTDDTYTSTDIHVINV